MIQSHQNQNPGQHDPRRSSLLCSQGDRAKWKEADEELQLQKNIFLTSILPLQKWPISIAEANPVQPDVIAGIALFVSCSCCPESLNKNSNGSLLHSCR